MILAFLQPLKALAILVSDSSILMFVSEFRIEKGFTMKKYLPDLVVN